MSKQAADKSDLQLIVEALEQSTPNAAHYPEPCARHAAALKAARALAASPEQSDKNGCEQ